MESSIYCNEKTWLEGPAVEQFRRVLTFPGILRTAANKAANKRSFLTGKIVYRECGSV